MRDFPTIWAEELPPMPENTHIAPGFSPTPHMESHCTEETEEPEVTEETDEPDETDVVPSLLLPELQKSALSFVPSQMGETNKPLFAYARAVRGWEIRHKINLSQRGCREVFNLWERPSRPFLRTNNDYFLEFLDKLESVNSPEGIKLQAAFELAKKSVPPNQVNGMSAEVKLVACLCRELQRIAGKEGPFYLAGRACADLLGRESHSTVATWLRAFCSKRCKLLKLVEQGRNNRASRYRYIGEWDK